MYISFPDTYKALAEYYDPLWDIVSEAWEDYRREVSPAARAVFSPRSRASNVHDFMIARCRRFSETVDGVETRVRKAMCVMVVENSPGAPVFGIRFKKLDEDGISRNQPTQQVRKFRSQDDLPGLAPAHHLEVGYVLSRDQTQIVAIEMVHPSGDRSNFWRSEILPFSGIQGASIDVLVRPLNDNGPRNVTVTRKDSIGDIDSGESAGTN